MTHSAFINSARAATLVAAAIVWCAPATAQLELDWRDGRLGSQVEYQLFGGANEIVIFLPSAFAGPTPLAFAEPLDPRNLEVGLDLLALLAIVQLGPSGSAQLAYSLPLLPAIAGAPLHAQAVSLGANLPMVPLFGDLSNPTRFTLLAPGGSNVTAQPLFVERRYHAAAAIPDGPLGSSRVFLSGGEAPATPFAIRQDWEIVDPSTERVTSGGPLLAPRTRHQAAVLANGSVLLVGGLGGVNASALATAEIYLPDLDQVVPAAPLQHARVDHTATVLADGRVLVVGGFSGPYSQDHPLGFPHAYFGNGLVPTSFAPVAELFDPVNNTWTSIPSIGPRAGHDAVRLGDGTVLIAGGVVPGSLGVPEDTSTCLRFDPTTMTATAAASLPTDRSYPSLSPALGGAALLAGGGPLSVGSTQVTVGAPSLSTLRFDPVAGTWTPIAPEPSEVARVKIRCIRMPDGSIRYVRIECPDGRIDQSSVGSGPPAVHFLNPGGAVWVLDGTLLQRRPGHSITELDERARLLITGAALAAVPGGTGTPDRTLEAYPYAP